MKKDQYPDDPALDEEDEKSKSQVKREMHELVALGAELVKLPKEQFSKIELPESLYDAIVEGRRITQHGAHKRQLQYIGKLMRNVDATQIREQIERLLTEFPSADRQYLRQLIRNAKKEIQGNKPPKSARSLFKYLRELLDES